VRLDRRRRRPSRIARFSRRKGAGVGTQDGAERGDPLGRVRRGGCAVGETMTTAILLACLAVQDGWTQAKFDARRSGYADREVGESLGLLAAIPTADAIRTSPVIADGKIYVVDASGRATCVDAATFRVLWRFDSRGGPANCNNVSSPALAGKYLHYG